ncbi:MAG: hypothetical protein ACFCU6_16440 [Balneolaceae bacterium]
MENTTQNYLNLSTKDWLITLIIASIPIVNIVMFFVWAFGDGTHPNKANWAKASLLYMVILAALYVLIVVIIFGIMFGTAGGF